MRLPDGEIRTPFCNSISDPELFRGLNLIDHKTLSSMENLIWIAPAVTVIHAGDAPVSIYFHRKGRAVVSQCCPGQPAGKFWPAGVRRFYGVVEALSDSPFDISLRTLSKCEFAVIDRDDFLGFIRDRPALSFRVAKIIGRLNQRVTREMTYHDS